MLKPTHKADGTIPLPVCEDDSYNYYKRKGCWYEGYDRNQMYQELLQTVSAEAHTTELCFASREAYDQAVADIDVYKRQVEMFIIMDAVFLKWEVHIAIFWGICPKSLAIIQTIRHRNFCFIFRH